MRPVVRAPSPTNAGATAPVATSARARTPTVGAAPSRMDKRAQARTPEMVIGVKTAFAWRPARARPRRRSRRGPRAT